MKYRKLLASILCVMLFTFGLNVPTFAAWASVSGGGTYSIGDTVCISISAGDAEIYAIEGTLSFDGSVLSGASYFADSSDSTVVYLEVVGYGSTSVYADVSYSDGEGVYYAGGGSTWVEVPEPQGGSPEEMNEDNWDDSWDDSDDGNDYDGDSDETEASETTEETTVDPNLEKLNVTVGDKQLKVLQEFEHTNGDKVGDASAIATQKDAALEWLPELIGFTIETVEFEGNQVNVYRFNEMLDIYVLTDSSGANGAYYVYDESNKAFSPLPYLYVGDKLVAFADFPDDQDIPEGYELADVNVGSGSVKGLKYIAEKKGSSLNPLVSSDQDEFYIIYGVADGKSGYYSYDSIYQSAQRFNLPGVSGDENDSSTETKTEKQISPQSDASGSDSKFIIIIAVVSFLLVIAIILVIVFALKNKKNIKKYENAERERARAEVKNRIMGERTNRLSKSDIEETLDSIADEIVNEIDSEE